MNEHKKRLKMGDKEKRDDVHISHLFEETPGLFRQANERTSEGKKIEDGERKTNCITLFNVIQQRIAIKKIPINWGDVIWVRCHNI